MSNGTDNIVTAVQNASTSISTAVGNAASDVSGSVSAGATKVVMRSIARLPTSLLPWAMLQRPLRVC